MISNRSCDVESSSSFVHDKSSDKIGRAYVRRLIVNLSYGWVIFVHPGLQFSSILSSLCQSYLSIHLLIDFANVSSFCLMCEWTNETDATSSLCAHSVN